VAEPIKSDEMAPFIGCGLFSSCVVGGSRSADKAARPLQTGHPAVGIDQLPEIAPDGELTLNACPANHGPAGFLRSRRIKLDEDEKAQACNPIGGGAFNPPETLIAPEGCGRPPGIPLLNVRGKRRLRGVKPFSDPLFSRPVIFP